MRFAKGDHCLFEHFQRRFGYTGTDHTRERVPLLCWHRGMRRAIDLGVRNTYADMAATICEGFGLPDRFGATSFYQELEMK